MFYIVKVITIFKDDSKYVEYFEFRKLEQAKDFIKGCYSEPNFAEYKDEIHILRCEEIESQ